MNEETFINKKITNQDIYDKLEKQGRVQDEILEHAKLTNGRVTKLEARSIGMWIANHPFKFTVFVVVFLSFIVSDFRHPIFDLLMKSFL